ncbi:uncharacterized protein PGTG_20800 [Puccinia graminis f. sp. tritici CRL 75-36-700-3]|uniref:Uncharacterized protein n=1 Tax=Puccinia graminis f. sp. tritici (strain CRL 75-36-700-3 / race SCCL) TaxID=418459 RepID=H6QPP6_PUCGT|nr:uncharacterized protein PGTG_20800 [Puccinia graminis f. sp. tritici CRL 75-36-700-3]EHS64098.1 hypothetical protein PGTG_20800 [Puccinia graminis f. sp. tritici CRL 75-36-700-3]
MQLFSNDNHREDGAANEPRSTLRSTEYTPLELADNRSRDLQNPIDYHHPKPTPSIPGLWKPSTGHTTEDTSHHLRIRLATLP